MRPRLVSLALLCLLLASAALPARADDDSHAVSFNISTAKSFAPGEPAKIHLYTHNVDALEFRIYRVHDPVKFLENLRELHSFGSDAPASAERIDERSWLERFHDWKARLWSTLRYDFRSQFSRDARRSLRAHQSTIERHSRIVTEAEFAQIPLLNSSQLVGRWRQLVPPTFISDSNTIPVPNLAAGLYLLEATDGHYKAYTLVFVTQMALVTRVSSGSVGAFVVDRKSGQPLPGVTVENGFGQKQIASATTADDGFATLDLPKQDSTPDNFWVIAHQGDEVAVSTPATWSLNYSSGGRYEGYAFTDRPVYRPTHTVHWKAILREHSGNVLVLPQPSTIHVAIADADSKTIFEQDMPLPASGDLTGDLVLPKDAALGYYYLRIGKPGEGFVTASFHVEDYRKPEYRVSVASKDKHTLQGQPATVTIDSRYFFGEPVANAKVKYRIYRAPHFWWGDEDAAASAPDTPDPSEEDNASSAGEEDKELTGKLDSNGLLTIQVPTSVPKTNGFDHTDLDYTVEAGVTDAANREIIGRGRFLSTYSTFRIHVEPVTYAVHPNQNARFNITAVDYDDKPVSTRVHVQLTSYHWNHGKAEYLPGPSVDVTTDAAGHASGELPVGTPQYSSAELQATASAVQPNTPNPTASNSIWIAGLNNTDEFDSGERAQILADKKSYAPGDIAHLTLAADTAGFYALVIAEGKALQKREVVHSDAKAISFDLPITADSQPNITVSALFIKNDTLYQASKTLKVPPTQKQLQVQITPARDTLQPQQTVTYDVLTRDATGKPVPADFSFGVVDEAIYSLHPDSSGDMISALYPQRYVEAQVDSSLDYFFSGEAGDKSPMLAMRNVRFRPQLAQVKPGNEAKPRVRKAFPDTAFWSAVSHTDSTGHARVSFAFPDSLTTWRATVHAITTDSSAGSTINRVLVRKNVLVRMGTPRFMVQGDELVVPVIAHNYLDTATEAKLSLSAEGLDILSGATTTITLPAKGEATALWRLRAPGSGNARLTASAITSVESDALELSFPIRPAGVAKTLARSGVITQTATQATTTITFPADTDPATHTLRIEASPSIAGALFPALDYLSTFPYGCTEQTMSSFLPNVIVADTLQRLHVNRPVDTTDLKSKTDAGLARLKDYQHDDGGWGWWKEDASLVHMTAYVVAGLGQARQVGALTPDGNQMLGDGSAFLRKALTGHPRMRPELRASVVYALALAGDHDIKPALDLQWSRRNDLDPEALALTGLAMLQNKDPRATQIGDLLSSKALRKGELVNWTSTYVPVLDVEYNNDVEATAYAVRLLAKLNPDNPLLPSAAQWLMLQRDGGAFWVSTEQTAMVLFGLVDYLAASHELEADYTADIVLNGRSVGQHHFTTADATGGASFTVDLEPSQLQLGANSIQLIRRSGNGRIYWSARGRFFSTAKQDVQAGTLSLNLTRDYFTLAPTQKDGRIVYTLQPFKGTAQVGDILAVHEAINGTPERYLLLEDPIPAGAEFISNTESYEIDHRPGGWYDWYTRKEFHDDHAAFFADTFTGRQEVFYLIRIVNPGTFHISPSSVQPMYQPGIQATSDAQQLQVPAPTPTGVNP